MPITITVSQTQVAELKLNGLLKGLQYHSKTPPSTKETVKLSSLNGTFSARITDAVQFTPGIYLLNVRPQA